MRSFCPSLSCYCVFPFFLSRLSRTFGFLDYGNLDIHIPDACAFRLVPGGAPRVSGCLEAATVGSRVF
ncbi:hypothetical protein NDU88_003319 [Pleurodeles waltl]|uniref:Secreted protein n=1 Tax=Pleurodeles waltl TaxID=8319 RepID=A0AAV7MAQ0_PLEWA|nr:hypothetical protein NDU88_003319 [Pleurodeles waltl]